MPVGGFRITQHNLLSKHKHQVENEVVLAVLHDLLQRLAD